MSATVSRSGLSRAVLSRARRAHPDLGGEVMHAKEARRQLVLAHFPKGPEVAAVEDTVFAGPDGDPLPARWYLGSHAAAPTLVFLHGGGFVIGDLDTHDGVCRSIASATGWRVLAVEYRLAPEHPFPAALADADAAVREVVAATGRPVFVGGDSAGGALATVTARRLGRTTRAPLVCGQVLLYPVTDLSRSWRDDPPSLLTATHMRWYRSQYATASQWALGDVSPLRAGNLRSCPPAVVLIAEHDPLAPEGREYAQRLRTAGVTVDVVEAAGVAHGTLGMGSLLPEVRTAEQRLATALHKLERVAEGRSQSHSRCTQPRATGPKESASHQKVQKTTLGES